MQGEMLRIQFWRRLGAYRKVKLKDKQTFRFHRNSYQLSDKAFGGLRKAQKKEKYPISSF